MLPPPFGKLDGWKAIADYLGRTERTAQRWAHDRGLPVHHLPGGKGSTVFAFRDEFDAWLRRDDGISGGGETVAARPSAGVPSEGSARPWRPRALSVVVVGIALVLLAIGAAITARSWGDPETSEIHRVELEGPYLVARDALDRRMWTLKIPSPGPPAAGGVMTARLQRSELLDFDADGHNDALAFMYFSDNGVRLREGSERGPERLGVARSVLIGVSAKGEQRWVWEPATSLTFAGRRFDGPWRWSASLTLPLDGQPRTHVALIHEPWWPSFIATLDGAGKSALRYVQAGHIYAVANAEVAARRFILVAGVNNEYSAASIAVLDSAGPAATSPQTVSSPYYCDRCPTGRPVRLVLFPRTEVNRASGNPYNRAHEILVGPEQIEVSVFEDDVSRVIYTLSRDLVLQRVTMSDRYWETHRRLERESRLTHTVEACPEHDGVEGRVWTPDDGWTTVLVPNSLVTTPQGALTPRPIPIP